MNKNNFIRIIFLCLVAFFSFQVNAENTSDSPWVAESGLKNTMPIYAQVYKDNAIFEPKGVMLGVFKESKCYGFTSLINGPTGNLFQLTMMCNNDKEDGFSYKVYDPNTKTFYTVTESISFTNGVAVGKIFAPIQLHISGIASAIQSTEINPCSFSVYPNPVQDYIHIQFRNSGLIDTKTVIELFNITGKKIETIFSQSLPSGGTVSVKRKKEWKKGLYILKSEINKQKFAIKIWLN